ncbi:MAG: hypothetical protein LAT75_03950 [Candidatus Cyclonatronum sp.]|uniref:hypothetical protein n=1 Tax=Cyclonatronum sp. TaxID=3024185 RepID=UPI0025BA038A|nr:hypothetical protein [Cyclonatronum sp.]MCC5932789.1 hypothetical protein [Balneolales bacterium]MCH8485992.1 hypothetical protein [Cyclonatronum sp.]
MIKKYLLPAAWLIMLSGLAALVLLMTAFFYYVNYYERDLNLPGCTDTAALNFDSSAVVNSGNCVYPRTVISHTRRARMVSRAYESSGLLYWQHKFWTQNDHADLNLYGFTFEEPLSVETVKLNGLQNIDWEEIVQDDNFLYVGDIGNNYGNRTNLLIYKIEKRSLQEEFLRYQVIRFRYEDQFYFGRRSRPGFGFDSEAFILKGEYIYLFTKEMHTLKTSVYRIPNQAGNHVARRVNGFNSKGMITGAMYLQEERLLALVGYNFPFISAPFIWLHYDFEGDDFFGGNNRRIGLNYFQFMPLQIEAITTIDGHSWYLTNEQAGLRRPFRFGSVQMIHEINLNPFLEAYFAGLPEPDKYYFRGFGELTDPANWFTNPNGSGRSPADFSAQGVSWHLTAEGEYQINQPWHISGEGSRLVIGNGEQPVKLTSRYPIKAQFKVKSASELLINHIGVPSSANE